MALHQPKWRATQFASNPAGLEAMMRHYSKNIEPHKCHIYTLPVSGKVNLHHLPAALNIVLCKDMCGLMYICEEKNAHDVAYILYRQVDSHTHMLVHGWISDIENMRANFGMVWRNNWDLVHVPINKTEFEKKIAQKMYESGNALMCCIYDGTTYYTHISFKSLDLANSFVLCMDEPTARIFKARVADEIEKETKPSMDNLILLMNMS